MCLNRPRNMNEYYIRGICAHEAKVFLEILPLTAQDYGCSVSGRIRKFFIADYFW